jgi:hypothetical protein
MYKCFVLTVDLLLHWIYVLILYVCVWLNFPSPLWFAPCNYKFMYVCICVCMCVCMCLSDWMMTVSVCMWLCAATSWNIPATSPWQWRTIPWARTRHQSTVLEHESPCMYVCMYACLCTYSFRPHGLCSGHATRIWIHQYDRWSAQRLHSSQCMYACMYVCMYVLYVCICVCVSNLQNLFICI